MMNKADPPGRVLVYRAITDKMQKPTLEQKERLKKARKEAYRKMKDKRDHDPNYIALKEAQKQRRKDISQDIKKRRAGKKEARKAKQRRKRDRQVLATLTKASDIIPKH